MREKIRAVFLDRDGVINEVISRAEGIGSPRRMADFHFTSNIKASLQELTMMNFTLFVVTNQPDVARNLMHSEVLLQMRLLIDRYLPIKDQRCCIHDFMDKCECRKPKPGMILDLAKDHNVDLHKSWMIGDRLTDMEAGRAAGCRTIFLKHATYSLSIHNMDVFEHTDHIVNSVAEAVDVIRRNPLIIQ